jgi:hypothetical protein
MIHESKPSYSHFNRREREDDTEDDLAMPVIHKRRRDNFLREKEDYDRRSYLGGGRKLWRWVVGGRLNGSLGDTQTVTGCSAYDASNSSSCVACNQQSQL